MKRFLSLLLLLALVLSMVPAVALPKATAAEELPLTWSQGTYYDNAINPNLISRKYTVINVCEGDVVTFDYPSANWAIYVYYADAQGSFGYVTSKQGSNETFVVQEINGRVPTQLRLTAFHRSGNNVTITDQLWETFDVVVSKTSLEPMDNTFTFATQNVGLWYDGVNQGVPANMVEARAKAWQEVMTKHGIDMLVGQEWLPYLDSAKTVDANEKVFGSMYPYMYGNNTATYDGKNIISRTPLTDITYTTMVSNVGRRYAKAYTTINGKRVCILNSHLSFEEDIEVNRKEEIVELLNIAQTEKYVIIAGDFNVFTPDEFEIFEKAGYSLANCGAFGQLNTWPNLGRNPTADVNRVIDNIIVSPGIKIHNAYSEDHQLSDHALLVAELELLEDGAFTDNRLLCEHCNQFVEWIPCTATNGTTFRDSGHYYLAKDLPKANSQFWIGVLNEATPDVVLDLRGHTVTSSSRGFYLRKNSKLSIVDTVGCGIIRAASGSTGGVVYVESGCTFSLYDGKLVGTNTATAKKGGAIYLENSAKLIMKGGEIHGGYGIDGGAICCGNKNTIDLSGGAIYGSEVTGAGGAIYMYGGTLNMTGGTIYGGNAKGSGGGAIYANFSALNLYGGSITGGVGTYGGNVHTTANASAGGINLGDCTITGGTASGAGKDIYLSGDGKLKVLKTFSGTNHIAVNATHLPGKNPGDALNTSLDSAEGHFPGKLILDSLSSKPQLCGADGETSLYIASAALVDSNYNLTWYAHNKSAVTHYGNAICLFPAAGALELTGGNYAVDLGGKNLAITGTGNVACFDSANDTYETFGTATISGPTLVNDTITTANGKDYVALNKDGVWSFHRLEMKITGVGLRPSQAGFYYKSSWNMDDTLADSVAAFGVAVSVYNIPTLELMQENGVAWTEFAPSELKKDTAITGVMIANILKPNAPDNIARAKMPIFGTTYLALKDGRIGVSDDSVGYSLYDVVKLADEKAYTQNAEKLDAFYAQWEDVLSTWQLENMGK